MYTCTKTQKKKRKKIRSTSTKTIIKKQNQKQKNGMFVHMSKCGSRYRGQVRKREDGVCV